MIGPVHEQLLNYFNLDLNGEVNEWPKVLNATAEGEVALEKLKALANFNFMSADNNTDGSLSRRESPLATLLFLAGNDVNKDGVITLAEAAKHWVDKDSDENGLVSLEELRQWAEKYFQECKDSFEGHWTQHPLIQDLRYVNIVLDCDDVTTWIDGLEDAMVEFELQS